MTLWQQAASSAGDGEGGLDWPNKTFAGPIQGLISRRAWRTSPLAQMLTAAAPTSFACPWPGSHQPAQAGPPQRYAEPGVFFG